MSFLQGFKTVETGDLHSAALSRCTTINQNAYYISKSLANGDVGEGQHLTQILPLASNDLGH